MNKHDDDRVDANAIANAWTFCVVVGFVVLVYLLVYVL